MARKNRTLKLTPARLRRIVLEEKRKMMETVGEDPVADGIDSPEDVDAAENDADDLANTLVKDLDHIKALKIQERRLMRRIRRLREVKRKIRTRAVKKFS